MSEKIGVPGRAVHRFAVLLVCIVWPLVWVGSLVTTYDAGMAVPDWPGTYGYNMFLYPWDTWLYGPFDLFIEHGHRLLGSLAGLVAIGTLIAAYFGEPRRWVIWLAAGVLLAVCFQGLLGGLRVVQAERTLAMIHGCFAQAFFGLCSGLAVVTSRWWWQRGPMGESGSRDERVTSSELDRSKVSRRLMWVAGLLAVAAYGQVLLGAQLRHVQASFSPTGFRHLVETHVGVAVVVWVLTGVLAIGLWRCGDLALSRPTKWLVLLVGVQICLGLATWLVNYGLPVSTERWEWAAAYVIRAKGYMESLIVSAHVATGSLLVAVSVALALRIGRAAEGRREYSNEIVATRMGRAIA